MGAGSDHPALDPAFVEPFRAALDRILTPIDVAEPLRVARKRDAFRMLRSQSQLLEQRAELMVASMLARAGVSFEFAAHHPDLVLGAGDCGIEVGTRALDSQRHLHDTLEGRLTPRPELHVTLAFDRRPLKLPRDRCAEVVDDIATGTYHAPTNNVRFDDLGLTALVTVGTEWYGSQVVIQTGRQSGSSLSEYMMEVERELDNKIAQKRRQGTKVPTLLLIDIGRVGEAWLRPASVWLSVLRSKLAPESFAGLGVMVSTLDRDAPHELSIALDSSAPSSLSDALERVAETFEFELDPDRPGG